MAKTSQSARTAVPAHLAKFEKIIPDGAEWAMAAQDWVVLQLAEGVAYAFDSKGSRELPLGGVIVCPPKSQVALTASVLGRAVFRGMALRVGSLTGFLTAPERQCLETEVARQCAPFLSLAPDHAIARRLAQVFAQEHTPALASRLAFAQTFAELVAPQLREALNQGMKNETNQQEAKIRLRQILGQIPESELSNFSLPELARQMHCCERHASRLFREECGTSFPSFVSDIRLRKACHLLLEGNLKIVDVALESGHGSLAHFNYAFKMKFRMTPTEWRERQTTPARRSPRSKLLQIAAAVVWLLLSVCVAEVRGQRAEVGGQRSEVGGQRSEVGGQRSEVMAAATNSGVLTKTASTNAAIAAAGTNTAVTVTNTAVTVTNTAVTVTNTAVTVTNTAVTVTNTAVTVTNTAVTVTNTAVTVTNTAATATNAAIAVRTNGPAAPAAKYIYKLDRFEVLGNTLLTTNVIASVLAPFTGEGDVDQFVGKIKDGMGALQLEYFRRGWYTVHVSYPPQTPTNGVVLLQVVEGKLAAIRIAGNRYFSSNNIMRALPYLQTLLSGDLILNTNVFQVELNRANSNPDRQIQPEILAGLEPGTSALKLGVTDHLPLHGRLEFDNYNPPGTPELRLNGNLSYANLWQMDNTLGLQYGFSPEKMKPSLGEGTHESLYPMDAPDVTYYSGFYRAPLGPPAAVEDQIAQDPNHFGYNETTRQFVQPPAIGRPEFTAYASRSTTGPTIYGPETSVVDTSLLKIEQQLITQQYTSQTTVGGRLSFPLPKWQGIQSSLSLGMDYKEDKVVTLPTNNFYYTTIVTHGNNASAPPTIIHNSISIAEVPSYPSLQYTPLFLGWSGSRQDHWMQSGSLDTRWSQFDGGISLVAGSGGTLSRDKAFPTLISNNKEATTEFYAIRPQLSRTQVLPDNFTLYGSLSGQWANEPLLNLEQFELGGNGSARGYEEGEVYADAGWLGQAEARSPTYWRGTNVVKIGTQVTAFTDYGKGYLLDQAPAQTADYALWDAGLGVNFHFGPYVESHILLACPLLNSAYSVKGHARILFSVSAQY